MEFRGPWVHLGQGGLYPRCCFNGPPRYGAPGVELTGLHKEMATVTQLHFLPGQVGMRVCVSRGPQGAAPFVPHPTPLSLSCRPPPKGWLLSLLDDNTLHLWEVCQKDGCSHLEETRSFGLPGRPGSDSTECLLVWGGCLQSLPHGAAVGNDPAAGWEWRVGAPKVPAVVLVYLLDAPLIPAGML